MTEPMTTARLDEISALAASRRGEVATWALADAAVELLAEVRRARAAEAEARAALAEARRDALIEARSIARSEAIRLEDQFLDHSRGARCVAYLLTRALKESQ